MKLKSSLDLGIVSQLNIQAAKETARIGLRPDQLENLDHSKFIFIYQVSLNLEQLNSAPLSRAYMI